MTRNAIALSHFNLECKYIQLSPSPKKGANARRERRLLPSSNKKTKALLKQVTGTYTVVAGCQVIIFKNIQEHIEQVTFNS